VQLFVLYVLLVLFRPLAVVVVDGKRSRRLLKT